MESLIQEIELASGLELPFLVLHPGAHLGAGEVVGHTILGEHDDTSHSNSMSEWMRCIPISWKGSRGETQIFRIARQYPQIALQDFFHSELGAQVRDKLMSKRGDKS